MAKKENTQEIGFEQQIWKAADKLRGNLDASEYKSVVLGLIFLKYISDKFEERWVRGRSRRIHLQKHLFRPPGSALVDNCGAGSYAGDWQSDR